MADDEFRFGRDLLAAPVVRAGARSRPVYPPRGRWQDARAALPYDAAGDGAFHAVAAAALTGGRTVTARATLDELPPYVRDGAVLPLLAADVSTLSSYGRGVVRLADRRDRLRLLAFPGPRTTAGMFSGEAWVGHGTRPLDARDPRRSDAALHARGIDARPAPGARARTLPDVRDHRRRPRAAALGLAAARAGVLTATLTARRATVVVRDA